MIHKPTVLVLGAGASIPYGFPSGRDLLFKIYQDIHNDESTLSKELTKFGFYKSILIEFSDSLYHSMQPSVDAFLERQPRYIEIGKAAIACSLIPFESNERLFRSKEMGWYEYLFTHLAADVSDFKNNCLSIITFNYDRSLETFLLRALEYSYGVQEEECADMLNSIPIVHVHGQLGELPYYSSDGRPYKPTINKDVLRKCIGGIQIIHEELQETKQFIQAHDLLREAQKICFLGFGYNSLNIERLKVLEIESAPLYGSAYGIEEAEQAQIKKMVNNKIKLGSKHQDCLQYLRRSFPLE